MEDLFDFSVTPGYIRIMNPLDMAFLGILVVSLIYSTWKGLVRDVFSLVGILGGFLVAARFYPYGAVWLKPWVKTDWTAALVACGVLFLVTFLVVSLLGSLLGRSLKLLKLGWLDRTAGFGFGFLKGLLLCLGLFLALAHLLPSKTPVLEESRLAPVLLQTAREIGKKMPGQAGKWLRDLRAPGWDRDGGRKSENPGTHG